MTKLHQHQCHHLYTLTDCVTSLPVDCGIRGLCSTYRLASSCCWWWYCTHV